MSTTPAASVAATADTHMAQPAAAALETPAAKSAAPATALGGGGAAAPADDKARTSIGANGGPEWDWRAEVAGDDPKALETLARMKAPTDLWKSYSELRGKLSSAQKPSLKLPDDASPEQVQEYRKAFDVPEVPKEAKDAAYAEAYGIKAPDGYEMGEVEKQMLGGFAKSMNASHAPKAIVQKAVGEYFKIQAATAAAAEKIAADKKKEWTGGLQDKWGRREYDARIAAASSYLGQQFEGREGELQDLMAAQLPGGGRVGDHPWMIERIVEMAMGAGHTDRIEANALEAGGKSLAEQHAEINAMRFTDRARYNEAAAPGGRLEKIINARLSRGEIDEHGNPVRKRA